jgi:hypothetical protein
MKITITEVPEGADVVIESNGETYTHQDISIGGALLFVNDFLRSDVNQYRPPNAPPVCEGCEE